MPALNAPDLCGGLGAKQVQVKVVSQALLYPLQL